MKLWVFLTLCVLAATALPIEEQAGRINGENGWYVPLVNGDLRWLSMREAKNQLVAYEVLNELEISERISLNAVHFYLYTRSNPSEGEVIKASRSSIDASNFNPANPTRITIHGWNSNYKDGVNTGVRDAWFTFGDYNMIAVDWSRGRSLEYASSVAGAPGAGGKIADLVDFLVKEYGMSLQTLEVVGFSLGAHVAGHTAKQVTTGLVQKVVGLDPAMPMVSYDKPAKRLSSNDAFYVETIQTNGGTLGYTKPIGRAAFYPNGGKTQPGCGLDLTGGCSHTRAVSYYVESLRLNNFPTVKCPSYEYANKKECGNTYSSIRMGSVENEFVAVGEFYVPVNTEYPYGLGEIEGNDEDTTTVEDNNDDTTTAAPEIEETTVSPGDDGESSTTTTTAAPEIEETTVSPGDDGGSTTSTTTAAPEIEETTVSPGDDGESTTSTTTPEVELPTSTTTTAGDTTTSTSTSSPGVETTTAPPEDDKEDGKDHRTNIYILNLIFINTKINKSDA